MAKNPGLLRKAHFLGAKIRSLRKQNGLTLEDLSVRCIQIDAEAAPSVSYLSMIETGQRMPSEKMLLLFAQIFQKDMAWFLDGEPVSVKSIPSSQHSGGIDGMPLEPGFLFSKELLRTAIPELLAQTGTSGRQFAHLLIRAHQESHRNRFPALERAAEEVGQKKFPLQLEDLFVLCKKLGLKIVWFDKDPLLSQTNNPRSIKTLVRSFFEPPGTIYINKQLEAQPNRLRYDLAGHIAHKVLHGGDGLCSLNAAGTGTMTSSVSESYTAINSKDILYAWRDFECSFFAGALLCPKFPFRQFLSKNSYAINCGEQLGLTYSVVMRRMTAVSPYEHWHYFDAYPPGILQAVYRGNGIPLPWGNMRMVLDPCKHWAVFRLFDKASSKPTAQISILKNEGDSKLYCCESVQTKDAAGNKHVVCAGVDLAPGLQAQGFDAEEIIAAIEEDCQKKSGSAMVPKLARTAIDSVGKILNIGWVSAGLENEARIICPRSASCPRTPSCVASISKESQNWDEEIKHKIVLGAG